MQSKKYFQSGLYASQPPTSKGVSRDPPDAVGQTWAENSLEVNKILSDA